MNEINVTIYGFGYVGSILSGMLLHDLDLSVIRINVIDPNPDVVGEFLDLRHTQGFYPGHSIHLNDAFLLRQADFVFHVAGIRVHPGKDRLSIGSENTGLTSEIFRGARWAKDPYFIVITNPVDVVTYWLVSQFDLNPTRVIGTGTLLDTLRLQSIIARKTNVPADKVETWVLGEHGDSQVAIFSETRVRGRPIRELMNEDVWGDCVGEARNAARVIRQTQPSTWWGAASCAHQVFRVLVGVGGGDCPLSVFLNDAFFKERLGVDGIALGLPVILSDEGFRIRHDLIMNDEEWEKLRASAQILKARIDELELKT